MTDTHLQTELRLIQESFMWFHNTYPHLRGMFFRIRNENTNRISGAIGKATGIIPGVADSCLLIPDGNCIFIEFKSNEGKLSGSQKKWMQTIQKFNHNYIIIDSLEKFKELCLKLHL